MCGIPVYPIFYLELYILFNIVLLSVAKKNSKI